jgi:hypothetical protein
MNRGNVAAGSVLVLVLSLSACADRPPADHAFKEQASPSGSAELVGYDLAEQLGLGDPLQTDGGIPAGCKYFAEVEDGLGFCLDPVIADGQDPYELMLRINGHIPTNEELEIHRLLDEADRLTASGDLSPEEDARLHEIEQRVEDLRSSR